MTNVYEGPTDARQSDDVNMPVSRFRPSYRALSHDEKALHDEIKAKAVELEELFCKVKMGAAQYPHAAGRYHALALTSLEQSVMWIVKELTS